MLNLSMTKLSTFLASHRSLYIHQMLPPPPCSEVCCSFPHCWARGGVFFSLGPIATYNVPVCFIPVNTTSIFPEAQIKVVGLLFFRCYVNHISSLLTACSGVPIPRTSYMSSITLVIWSQQIRSCHLACSPLTISAPPMTFLVLLLDLFPLLHGLAFCSHATILVRSYPCTLWKLVTSAHQSWLFSFSLPIFTGLVLILLEIRAH